MESSFFEYRDKTGVDSDSDDTEVIDNSLVEDSGSKKKNRTAFVAESEESGTDDGIENEILRRNMSKSVVRRSSVAEPHIISSSEDDTSKRGSLRRTSDVSYNKVVLSSSDEGEEEPSPEMLPRRRPPIRPSNESNKSIIGRKNKKRMILLDSDTENSIVIEHDRHRKLACLKDTPLKIADNKENRKVNDSEESMSDGEETGDESEDDESVSEEGDGNDDEEGDDDDDGPDEDEMVMSRATRMSIMGVVPKGNDSDESDFIQSDDSSRKSESISRSSLADFPDSNLIPPHTDSIPNISSQTETVIPKIPEKTTEALDDSQLTCSPFTSPSHNVTKEVNESFNNVSNVLKDKNDSGINIISANENKIYDLTNVVPNNLASKVNKENFIRYDDDVTIIDTKPEIIALSSDDEDVVQVEKKSPRKSKSPKPKLEKATSSRSRENTITQYLAPPSYPNQQVVYVKKAVKENELTKLNSLNADLFNVRRMLDAMELSTLPDGGSKLLERLSMLEAQVKRQGDKVANMIVEPDKPSAKDIAQDGFEKGLTWDEIQKASTAVQPRMFGKQAMATHMYERNLIMDRLRDLHSALASRPAETELSPQPSLLTTRLMPHQLHALAWLQWRETQRPRAGILADDMGLGKTITMIALMASDKKAIDNDDDEDDDDEPGKSKAKLTRGGTLVVCPASLMQQWGGEVSKHCAPHQLSVCLHHGPARATQPHRLAVADLVVTTYNILQRDHEKNGVLMRILWRRVILDEAHIVRNYKAATSVAVSGLRATRRWCLTGTPVQNKDLDLFALLKFLKCTPFDDLTMWKKWIDNKSIGGQERLSTVMRCILLRRTKAQLQQKGQLDCLPQRDTHQELVTLTKPEMNVYQKVLVFSKTLFAQFLHQRADKNADAQSFTAGKQNEYDKMHKKMIALQGAQPVKSHEILVLLLRLRQVCCHCGLIAAMLDEDTAGDVDEDPAGKDLLAELNKLTLDESNSKRKSGQIEEEEKDEPAQEGTTAAEAIRSVLSPNNPVFEMSRQSSKISAVMDCLNNNVFSNKGDKAVVVSQWTSVLRLVEAELKKSKIKSVTLSGNVPVPARPPLIDAINDPRSEVRVMLLSLCAGGVGLNLCGANHLLLLDPHWNPQLEEQAQDRIYRVGQKKHVHIYRFMCVDTVEQNIRKLQEAKLELAENVLTGAKNTNASKLSIEDLKMLFNMGTQE